MRFLVGIFVVVFAVTTWCSCDESGGDEQVDLVEQGQEAFRHGRYALAIEKYQEALKEHPRRADIHNLLGMAYRFHQERGNEVVFQSSVAMSRLAQQVRGTTEEQARGSGRIAESVEGVRDAVEQINGALQEQSATCRSAVEMLGTVSGRTRSNEESVRRMDQAAKDLLRQAEALREDVRKFQV